MSVNTVKQDGSLQRIAGGTLYADAPIGAIMPYGGATAPSGWFLCQGQAVSRTTYAELFAVIGTAFGTGDGSTTFNLPDFRGEFLRGAGTNSHSGQGSGGSVGEHQDATRIPDFYVAGNGSFIVSPAEDSLWHTTDAQATLTTGYKTVSLGGTGTTNIPSHYSTRPTNTSVNYIIKAKQVALPTDFKDEITDIVEEVYGDVIPSDASASNKLVTESDITPSGTRKTIHRNYTNLIPSDIFGVEGVLTKTPKELIDALKAKGYIVETSGYNQLHCTINFVNTNTNKVIMSDGTHSIDLVNGWIEFEGAFISGTSTFHLEERWVMRLYNVTTGAMAIVTKRANTNPIMKTVTMT